jgi:hypothetical protein
VSEARTPQDHLRKKPAIRIPVTVIFDRDVDAALRAAERRLAELRDQQDRRPSDERAALLSEAEADLERVRAEAEECSQTYVFKKVSRAKRRELSKQHPPTEEQIELAKENDLPKPPYNEDTYVGAFLDLACIEPTLPPGYFANADESEEWNDGELVSIFYTVVGAYQEAHLLDLGKGSRGTSNSNGSSPTASPEESPTAVSWGGDESGPAT